MRYRILEFEKVLYKGNFAYDFFVFCLKQERRLLKYIWIHLYRFILFQLNMITEEKYYSSYFSFLKNNPNIEGLIEKFWDSYYYKINYKILWNQKTENDWVISSLPLELIKPIVDKLNIKNVTATNYDCKKGILDGKIMKGFDLKETIKEEMKKSKIEKYYGFHQYNKELFELSEHSYIVRRFGKVVPYKEKGLEKKKILSTAIIIALLVIWILAINFLFSIKVNDLHQVVHYFKQPMLVLLNGLPILLFLLMLYVLTNRLWISFGITNFAVLIMGFVNRTKLIYRDDPFIVSDLSLVSESLEMTKRYDLNITVFIILLILGSLFLMVLLFIWRERKKLPWKKRLIYTAILIVIMGFGFKPIYHNDSLYNKVGDKTGINIWSNTQQFQVRGFLYPFLHSSKVSTIEKPKDYDEKKVEEILKQYSSESVPVYENGKQVHVISIMLEAYQDFSQFDTVSLNKDIYKDFHEIEEKSYSGRIVSNVFGGGTINTERSYLTGFYNMPNFRSKTNSFVQHFRSSGYYTEAMHPIYGWFYNRRNVDEILGFHNFDYYENRFSKIQGSFLTDVDFFDYIIEGYEESRDDYESYFHFSVTYQNHGPYSTGKQFEEEYLTRTDNMDDATYNMINNYLHGIETTNEALKKIVDYFEKEEEPVVILVFADHNPYLGEDNIGYEQMGIDMDMSTEEGLMNYAGVPYFIWANEEAKELTEHDFVGDAPTISPMFLMPELFECLGWKGNEYLQYLTDLKKTLSVIHKPWYQENGKFVNELSEEGNSKWNEFLNVEYYWLKHYQQK